MKRYKSVTVSPVLSCNTLLFFAFFCILCSECVFAGIVRQFSTAVPYYLLFSTAVPFYLLLFTLYAFTKRNSTPLSRGADQVCLYGFSPSFAVNATPGEPPTQTVGILGLHKRRSPLTGISACLFFLRRKPA